MDESRPEVTSLAEHDKRSDERTRYLAKKIDNSVEKLTTSEKESKSMEYIPQDNTAALIAAMSRNDGGGTGAAMGGGLGAGLLGGLLGGTLFGNGGLGNRNNFNEGTVTPSQLTAALAGVTETSNTAMLQQSLGDVKAAIPVAEGQVQLALAGATADINGNINRAEISNLNSQAGISKAISEAVSASLASQGNINVNVLQQGSATRELVNAMGQANLSATKDSQFATQIAISNSTKEILAAIKDGEITTLNRQLATAEAALLEQRAIGRNAATEVNVTQTVVQNQQQLQAQQQQQQIVVSLAQLAGVVSNLQNAVATNSNLIVGNSGAVATGTQTANPVNVRA